MYDNFHQLVPKTSLTHHWSLTHISTINTSLLPLKPLFFSPHLSAWVLHIAVKTSSELVFLLVENYYLTTPVAIWAAGNIWNPYSRKRILFIADCPFGWSWRREIEIESSNQKSRLGEETTTGAYKEGSYCSSKNKLKNVQLRDKYMGWQKLFIDSTTSDSSPTFPS